MISPTQDKHIPIKFALISVDLPLDFTAAPLGCLPGDHVKWPSHIENSHPEEITPEGRIHRHAGTGHHDSSLWISKISTCLNLSNPAQFQSLKPTLCFQTLGSQGKHLCYRGSLHPAGRLFSTGNSTKNSWAQEVTTSWSASVRNGGGSCDEIPPGQMPNVTF